MAAGWVAGGGDDASSSIEALSLPTSGLYSRPSRQKQLKVRLEEQSIDKEGKILLTNFPFLRAYLESLELK